MKPSFQDCGDTVIIIDEIQESSEIYNRIREFTRQFQARFFIITGKLSWTVLENRSFTIASGDYYKAEDLYPFLRGICGGTGRGKLYQAWRSLPLPEADDNCPEVYDRLRLAYDQYCQIGGYPKVVEAYLERRDHSGSPEGKLVRIIQIFWKNPCRYFKDITDISVFTNIFLSICRILLRKRRIWREDSVSEELQKLVTKNYSSNLSKENLQPGD